MKPLRSPAALILSAVWLIIAVANLVDVAVRGRDQASAIAAAVLLASCGLAYALGLRPRVVAEETALVVHNLWRTARLPWDRITGIESGRVLTVFHEGGKVEAWAVRTSPRAVARARRHRAGLRSKAPQAVAEQAAGRTPVDFAAERLEEVRARSRGDGEVTVAWSWPALLAVLVPLAALAVLAAL